MIMIFFFLFYLDTLCNELDQERKARYAIQQKLKGNLETYTINHKLFLLHYSKRITKEICKCYFFKQMNILKKH